MTKPSSEEIAEGTKKLRKVAVYLAFLFGIILFLFGFYYGTSARAIDNLSGNPFIDLPNLAEGISISIIGLIIIILGYFLLNPKQRKQIKNS